MQQLPKPYCVLTRQKTKLFEFFQLLSLSDLRSRVLPLVLCYQLLDKPLDFILSEPEVKEVISNLKLTKEEVDETANSIVSISVSASKK
jgi:hypothetical protein